LRRAATRSRYGAPLGLSNARKAVLLQLRSTRRWASKHVQIA